MFKIPFPSRQDIPRDLIQTHGNYSKKVRVDNISDFLKLRIFEVVSFIESKSARDVQTRIHENSSRVYSGGRRADFFKTRDDLFGRFSDDFCDLIFSNKSLKQVFETIIQED